MELWGNVRKSMGLAGVIILYFFIGGAFLTPDSWIRGWPYILRLTLYITFIQRVCFFPPKENKGPRTLMSTIWHHPCIAKTCEMTRFTWSEPPRESIYRDMSWHLCIINMHQFLTYFYYTSKKRRPAHASPHWGNCIWHLTMASATCLVQKTV